MSQIIAVLPSAGNSRVCAMCAPAKSTTPPPKPHEHIWCQISVPFSRICVVLCENRVVVGANSRLGLMTISANHEAQRANIGTRKAHDIIIAWLADVGGDIPTFNPKETPHSHMLGCNCTLSSLLNSRGTSSPEIVTTN